MNEEGEHIRTRHERIFRITCHRYLQDNLNSLESGGVAMKGFSLRRIKTSRICLMILLGFLVNGCSTVPVDLAKDLAPEARATLYGKSPVFLMKVDDVLGSWDSGFNYKNLQGSYLFYLSPGVHTLIIGYKYLPKRLMLSTGMSPQGVSYSRISTQLGIIKFEAKPGHSYSLVGEATWETWKVSLQDTTAGESIANLPIFTGGLLTTQTCVTTQEGMKCDCDLSIKK
jgi:hypothetical protein